MPKLPRMTAKQAESLVLSAGFILLRTQGSHRIYFKEKVRVVIPFHAGKLLHPKIVKQIMIALEKGED